MGGLTCRQAWGEDVEMAWRGQGGGREGRGRGQEEGYIVHGTLEWLCLCDQEQVLWAVTWVVHVFPQSPTVCLSCSSVVCVTCILTEAALLSFSHKAVLVTRGLGDWPTRMCSTEGKERLNPSWAKP